MILGFYVTANIIAHILGVHVDVRVAVPRTSTLVFYESLPSSLLANQESSV
jgi:hypothetical protein